MEEYYPSEVARLVLGYLKEVKCLKTWKTFLTECSDLQEYYRLYKGGKIYITNVDGKSLLEILQEYRTSKRGATRNPRNRKAFNKANSHVSTSESLKTSNKKITGSKKIIKTVLACTEADPVLDESFSLYGSKNCFEIGGNKDTACNHLQQANKTSIEATSACITTIGASRQKECSETTSQKSLQSTASQVISSSDKNVFQNNSSGLVFLGKSASQLSINQASATTGKESVHEIQNKSKEQNMKISTSAQDLNDSCSQITEANFFVSSSLSSSIQNLNINNSSNSSQNINRSCYQVKEENFPVPSSLSVDIPNMNIKKELHEDSPNSSQNMNESCNQVGEGSFPVPSSLHSGIPSMTISSSAQNFIESFNQVLDTNCSLPNSVSLATSNTILNSYSSTVASSQKENILIKEEEKITSDNVNESKNKNYNQSNFLINDTADVLDYIDKHTMDNSIVFQNMQQNLNPKVVNSFSVPVTYKNKNILLDPSVNTETCFQSSQQNQEINVIGSKQKVIPVIFCPKNSINSTQSIHQYVRPFLQAPINQKAQTYKKAPLQPPVSASAQMPVYNLMPVQSNVQVPLKTYSKRPVRTQTIYQDYSSARPFIFRPQTAKNFQQNNVQYVNVNGKESSKPSNPNEICISVESVHTVKNIVLNNSMLTLQPTSSMPTIVCEQGTAKLVTTENFIPENSDLISMPSNPIEDQTTSEKEGKKPVTKRPLANISRKSVKSKKANCSFRSSNSSKIDGNEIVDDDACGLSIPDKTPEKSADTMLSTIVDCSVVLRRLPTTAGSTEVESPVLKCLISSAKMLSEEDGRLNFAHVRALDFGVPSYKSPKSLKNTNSVEEKGCVESNKETDSAQSQEKCNDHDEIPSPDNGNETDQTKRTSLRIQKRRLSRSYPETNKESFTHRNDSQNYKEHPKKYCNSASEDSANEDVTEEMIETVIQSVVANKSVPSCMTEAVLKAMSHALENSNNEA